MLAPPSGALVVGQFQDPAVPSSPPPHLASIEASRESAEVNIESVEVNIESVEVGRESVECGRESVGNQ